MYNNNSHLLLFGNNQEQSYASLYKQEVGDDLAFTS